MLIPEFTGTKIHPWRYPPQIARLPVCADVGGTQTSRDEDGHDYLSGLQVCEK